MDISELSEKLDYDAPLALGGCRCTKTSFECCEYNVIVFDEARSCEQMRIGDSIVLVRHDSIDMPTFGTFAHIPHLRVIRDESWSIGPKISAIVKKQDDVFKHATKSALVDSKIILHTARKSLEKTPQVSAFWTKCAAYRLADAISYHNIIEPNGVHMMSQLRALPNTAPNNSLSTVYDCLGLERSTPSLLERMLKSAIGFLNMAGIGEIESQVIAAKAHHLESVSLFTDSYYYICRTVCARLCSQQKYAFDIPDAELYALKVALDPDNNTQHTLAHIDALDHAVTEFMPHAGWTLQS